MFLDSITPSPESRAVSESLVFANAEPGDGQRRTTWTSITPSQRGPRPWPDWVVTSDGALDTELGIVKTGKEADLHLIERGEPGGRSTILAAKRYRGVDHRDFTRSSLYEEGRRTRRSRDARALAKGSAYGRALAADHWAFAEFEALCRTYELGAPVPYPVQVNGTELLMEFIGDGTTAAPRLAQVRDAAALPDLLEQVVRAMHLFARAGFAHGDLSPYNLLVHDGRVVVIDLPQIVDAVSNPNGLDLLHRDCVNIADWFTRRRVPVDAESLFGELLGELYA